MASDKIYFVAQSKRNGWLSGDYSAADTFEHAKLYKSAAAAKGAAMKTCKGHDHVSAKMNVTNYAHHVRTTREDMEADKSSGAYWYERLAHELEQLAGAEKVLANSPHLCDNDFIVYPVEIQNPLGD